MDSFRLCELRLKECSLLQYYNSLHRVNDTKLTQTSQSLRPCSNRMDECTIKIRKTEYFEENPTLL